MVSKKRKRVLFLCTGNSARSQMAEGFLKYFGQDRFKVWSAGINPVGVNPKAVAVMRETGIDISAQTSDRIDKEKLDRVDLLITLCGDARESCPLVPARVEKRHWPLEDPARAEGHEEEKLQRFREIRDHIKQHVFDLLVE